MNTTTHTIEHHPERVSAFKWLATGSVTAAIVAIAIIALAIVGLAGVYPPTLAAIATIVTAAALLLEGGGFEAAASTFQSKGEAHPANAGFGLNAEALGALAGIVLGILALMGVSSMTLLSIAVLVFGATLFLSGSMMSQKAWFAGPADGQLLLGLSATVLGLLAVIGVSSETLVLVGLLILGAAGLFCGSAKSFSAAVESH